MKTFHGIAAVESAVGTHLGYSGWHEIDQEQIDAFAAATGDHQWIHELAHIWLLAKFTGTDADYQLVAYAAAHGHTVVTHEQSNPASKKRVMIPDACMAMGVTSIGTFEMMRRTGAKLELTN